MKWLGMALLVCWSTASTGVAAPPGGDAEGPLVVKAVKASSALKPYKGHTFGAGNLVDGRVETSWQPVGGTTLGVGQWVELDLGGSFEVTGVEVDLGLQAKDPKLGDLFCRNTRPAYLVMVFDDGAWSLVAAPRADAKTIGRSEIGFLRGMKGVAAVKTRKVRLVIQQVEDPVDWRDVAIAEVRVFGRAVQGMVGGGAEVGRECGTGGYVPFSNALIEYCGGLETGERGRLRCGELVLAFLGCRASGPFGEGGGPAKQIAMPAIAVDGGTAGSAKVNVTAGVEIVSFESNDDGWRVTKIAPRPLKGTATESLVREDLQGENTCWEALGKKRPYEDWDKMLPDFGEGQELE